jgi:hypothetical protein
VVGTLRYHHRNWRLYIGVHAVSWAPPSSDGPREIHRLLAVAEFDTAAGRAVNGEKAVLLRRVGVSAEAPRGTEGILLNQGCPMVARITGVPIFVADRHLATICEGAGWLSSTDSGAGAWAMHYGRGRRRWWQRLSE